MTDDLAEEWLGQLGANAEKHWQLVKEASSEALLLLPRLETAIAQLCEHDGPAARAAEAPENGFILLHQGPQVVVGRSYGRVGFRRKGLLGWVIAVPPHFPRMTALPPDPTVIRIDLPTDVSVRFFDGRQTMTLRQAAEAGTVENEKVGGANFERTVYMHLLFQAAIDGIDVVLGRAPRV